MRRRFCYKCGEDDFQDGLCKEHFAESRTLLKLPARIEIEKCSKCDLVKLKNKYQQWNPERFFYELAKHEVTLTRRMLGKDFIYKVKIIGDVKGIPKEEEAEVRIHFNVRICGVCGRALGDYYEGILQLRGNFKQDVITFVEEEADKTSDRMSFYRIKQVKGGVDIYFGSQRFLKTLSVKISKKHKIKLVETFKQSTHLDGVEVHRRIVLARFK